MSDRKWWSRGLLGLGVAIQTDTASRGNRFRRECRVVAGMPSGGKGRDGGSIGKKGRGRLNVRWCRLLTAVGCC